MKRLQTIGQSGLVGQVGIGISNGQYASVNLDKPSKLSVRKRHDRAYALTPLEAFRHDHLSNADQIKRLRYGLDRAQQFVACYQETPGLSFVIAGPVGTGKTTICENLMHLFKRRFWIVDDDDADYLHRRPALPEFDQLVLCGRMLDATDLMRLLGDQSPLHSAFGGCDVVVIEDAGTEDFSTARYTPSAEQERVTRHRRYGRFVDYAYRRHITYGRVSDQVKPLHLLINSMMPLLLPPENGGDKSRLNPEFVDIFGQKAFSRLRQMAGGFMVDFSGLPDFREVVVSEYGM